MNIVAPHVHAVSGACTRQHQIVPCGHRKAALGRPQPLSNLRSLTGVCLLCVTLFVAATPTESLAQDRGVSADRMTAVAVPLATDALASKGSVGNSAQRLCAARAATNTPAWSVPGWESYQRLWAELAADPGNETIRAYLGLRIGKTAAENAVVIKSARGRSAPRWLGWKSGSYRQVETPHLQIFSHADDETTRAVALDMERVYWVWTQMFFPLWDGSSQVALHFRDLADGASPSAALANRRTRLTSRRKLRVVLLRDADDYARTLGRSTPGIEQSTGFYSDERLTSFFYPSDSADAIASRRHELIHQLFRESTRSRLAGESPGEQEAFWLIEGIAGYFESLHIKDATATVGGWDSPRLQFARYRVLGGRDFIPFDELRQGGKSAVQRQPDLARWYANAIAYTHLFLDGDQIDARRWVYRQLADLYQIPVEVPVSDPPASPERGLIDFLRIDDETLLNHRSTRELSLLCLTGCQTTSRGLAEITMAADCTWIDLSRNAISSNDVRRLCPAPTKLDQLSLEATAIDATLHPWLRQATELRELDLSWTACNDETVSQLASHRQLQTLWLTGSKITDASVDALVKLSGLESLDVQRTGISSAGVAELKRRRPDVKINPLLIRDQ